ncbi:ribosome small subunit-dependent GTPase A [Rubrivivax gelatinosus]|uniref:Small ribosomal subunit biogenesis GTPase RsgA n=1 Tax=Rubrivivax gelatinosus TaxID=28068 RepID=A0ABS1DTY3_RUBGE|nr:ribosome small subunit-dependent GTPase A [Rubrivivax gelatinosus]MBK1713186.1 ribosome small subunit-dependent GTPase A [Rubrivivax gelatinosus]
MSFEALDQGLVVAAHGRHVVVETPEGERVLCHPRGKKSELVVGDHVRWLPAGDEGVIEHLEPRRNLLFRQDEWRTKSFAANLDGVLMLVAGEPMFSESQLTRALIAAAQAGIPCWIGLNKTDLPAAADARSRLAPYRRMGVEVVELALGPSGMGKSTLINLLVPQAAAQVGEISKALKAGRHTTTTTSWYWLDEARSGALIDSPGFQEFGLRQILPTELATLMPDFAAALGDCRFHNCSHRHEPGCGVRAAIERGEISPSRQRIYEELFAELSTTRW